MMSTYSHITSPLPSSRHDQVSNGIPRGREGGSGSESDWTGGTGEDWTGASSASDSAFITNLMRSHRHAGSDTFSSSGVSPSPPPPPRSSSQGDGIYTSLNVFTLNHDNHYASVDQLHSKSRTICPSPIKGAPPTMTTPLNSVAELGESQTEDDEYCKMFPSSGIRNTLMKTAPKSPVPGHRVHPLPPLPGTHPTLTSPLLPAHRQAPKHSNSLGEMYTPRE